MRPSGSNGSRAAAMPWTLRPGRSRAIVSSTVTSIIPQFAPEVLLTPIFGAKLQVFEAQGGCGLPIVIVKRITARGQPRARRRSAVAESAAHLLALQLAAANHIQRQAWISEYHPSQSHAIHPTFAHRTLSNVGQEIL